MTWRLWLREYRRYLESRIAGRRIHVRRDLRREHLPWFQTVFEAHCDGCGARTKVCPKEFPGVESSQGQRVGAVSRVAAETAPGHSRSVAVDWKGGIQ